MPTPSEAKSCLLQIRSRYAALTPAEKRVADLITERGAQVVSLPVDALAAQAGVAKSAVVRCCKSLGFSGYAALKLALAGELAKNRQLNYNPYIQPEDTPDSILDKVFSANVKTLHDTAEHIDRDILRTVVDRLDRAGSIYVYGIGTSAALVQDFQYRILLSGRTALAFTDVPTMKISTLNIQKGDVAFGISHSGRTVATIETLRLARERGAVTACITSYPDSPIARTCDLPLAVYSDEIRYPMEAVSARVAQMSVVDAIAIALSARDFAQAMERARLSYTLVNSVRYTGE